MRVQFFVCRVVFTLGARVEQMVLPVAIAQGIEEGSYIASGRNVLEAEREYPSQEEAMAGAAVIAAAYPDEDFTVTIVVDGLDLPASTSAAPFERRMELC